MTAIVRIGTCSWADETLSRHWYPAHVRSSEARLRHYAERFDTVEVDSTYYTLPSEEMVARWCDRTSPGFVFHVKAFGMMTRHPVKLEQLPQDLRLEAEADIRGRVERPSLGLRSEVFRRFRTALRPLRSAGKLGVILLQLPSYLVCRPSSLEYLEFVREELPGDELAVEFRHSSWFEPSIRAKTLATLKDRGFSHVIVDAPRLDTRTVVPTVLATTSSLAYVRLHGRNAATWNLRAGSAARRFDYLYSDEELEEWVYPLRELASGARSVYVMFNNNGRSAAERMQGRLPLGGELPDADEAWIAQAPTNALMLRKLLMEQGVKTSVPGSVLTK